MKQSHWDFASDVPWAQTSQDIVFIRDLDGPVSVTNDAENVWDIIQTNWPGRRLVYQGTDGEWWEIFRLVKRSGETVGFRPWHGLVWDKLSRTEQ